MKVQDIHEPTPGEAQKAVDDFVKTALAAIRKLQAQVKAQQRELDEAHNTIETLRQQSPWRDYGRPQR